MPQMDKIKVINPPTNISSTTFQLQRREMLDFQSENMDENTLINLALSASLKTNRMSGLEYSMSHYKSSDTTFREYQTSNFNNSQQQFSSVSKECITPIWSSQQQSPNMLRDYPTPIYSSQQQSPNMLRDYPTPMYSGQQQSPNMLRDYPTPMYSCQQSPNILRDYPTPICSSQQPSHSISSAAMLWDYQHHQEEEQLILDAARAAHNDSHDSNNFSDSSDEIDIIG